MGTDRLGVPILEYVNQRFSLVLVVTAPPSRIGRGRKKSRQSPIHRQSLELELPVMSPRKLNRKIIRKINQAKPDFILVYGYGQIIPLKDLKCPEILNLHPSLLPKLRGPSPIRYAIFRGYSETGVSLMKIDSKIDHGPIISQKKIKLANSENYLSLRAKVRKKALELVENCLPKYLAGKIKTKEQDHSQATFTPLIKKEDGRIDWNQPATMIERKIRAFNPWPGAFTYLNGQLFKIYNAKAEKGKLKLGEVQLEGKKRLNFPEFRRGYRKKLDFADKIV